MIKRKWTALLLTSIALVVTSGCVYRANIAQGNFIQENDLAQLEVGMTRSQVRFLLGTPMVDDPFHRDRWDYVYWIRIGRQPATFKRWLTIHFEGDTVAQIVEDQELSPDV